MHDLIDGKHWAIDLLAKTRRRQCDAQAIGFQVRLEIGISEDGVYTGQCPDACGVDAANQRMGVRTADERRLQHSGQVDIVDEPACAAKEIRVFEAPNVLAERLCAQGARPSALSRFAASSAAMTMFW